MVTREIRVYPDLHIAGMKGDKEQVWTTLTYDFDDYTIRVEQVFAWRDRETGEEVVPLDLALLIDEEVQKLSEFAAQRLAEERTAKVQTWGFNAPAPPAVFAMR